MNTFLVGLLSLYIISSFILSFRIIRLGRHIQKSERFIVKNYEHLLDIIPGLIESLRNNEDLDKNEVYKDLTLIHRNAIISRLDSLYDTLYFLSVIKKELGFLFRVTIRKTTNTQTSGLIYSREKVLNYLSSCEKEIQKIQPEIGAYIRLRKIARITFLPILPFLKNYTHLQSVGI